MFIRVIALVFMFLSKLRFPAKYSLIEIVRHRYGNEIVKIVRKFEDLDFKIRKTTLDLDFLSSCQKRSLIPKFLRFRLANRNLTNSTAYRLCQQRLLKEEISQKKRRIITLDKKFELCRQNLISVLTYFDFIHISTIFLAKNDRLLSIRQKVHDKKFYKLTTDSSSFLSTTTHDPDKVIYNFSSYELSDTEKQLLCKGLKFAIPPKQLNYGDYLVPFELLFRDIKNDTLTENRDFVKTRLKNIAFSTFELTKRQLESNLSLEEQKALKQLSRQKDIIIQKADKGNTVVIIDKNTYNNKINDILKDTTKFRELKIKPGKELNYIVNLEKKLRDVYKRLLESGHLDKNTYDKIKPEGSRPGILYGLCKVHKKSVNGSPPFRPILSAINTPTYNLAKFLVPILSPLTHNEYTVKDSFSFSNEVPGFDDNFFMASLDVESLFTNIPLSETIDICIDSLFENTDQIKGLTKPDLKELLTLATSESFFVFNGKFYTQIDGVAMGSPLGPTLANAFLCHYEKLWLNDCPSSFKPLVYRRYVDDIFVLLSSPSFINNLLEYFNSKHYKINFTFESEKDNTFSFLDILIKRDNGFKTSVYRKPTFSGVFTNFTSFVHISYKHSLIQTLLHRCYALCSDIELFHHEVSLLKNIFKCNGYPKNFVDFCINKFYDKLNSDKTLIYTVPRKEVLFVIPYLGKISLQLRTRLEALISSKVPTCKLKIVFSSKFRLQNCFRFKDVIPKELLSGLVYRFRCGGCNATYYGKTIRHFKVRACEHLGISHRTGKIIKPKESAIFDHLTTSRDCNATIENFDILSRDNNEFKLLIKESLFIKRDDPSLNRTIKSYPLFLYD